MPPEASGLLPRAAGAAPCTPSRRRPRPAQNCRASPPARSCQDRQQQRGEQGGKREQAALTCFPGFQHAQDAYEQEVGVGETKVTHGRIGEGFM